MVVILINPTPYKFKCRLKSTGIYEQRGSNQWQEQQVDKTSSDSVDIGQGVFRTLRLSCMGAAIRVRVRVRVRYILRSIPGRLVVFPWVPQFGVWL